MSPRPDISAHCQLPCQHMFPQRHRRPCRRTPRTRPGNPAPESQCQHPRTGDTPRKLRVVSKLESCPCCRLSSRRHTVRRCTKSASPVREPGQAPYQKACRCACHWLRHIPLPPACSPPGPQSVLHQSSALSDLPEPKADQSSTKAYWIRRSTGRARSPSAPPPRIP